MKIKINAKETVEEINHLTKFWLDGNKLKLVNLYDRNVFHPFIDDNFEKTVDRAYFIERKEP